MSAYDNRSVVIPEYEQSMPYVTEKIAKITVNQVTLRPKGFLKKDSIFKRKRAVDCCYATRREITIRINPEMDAFSVQHDEKELNNVSK